MKRRIVLPTPTKATSIHLFQLVAGRPFDVGQVIHTDAAAADSYWKKFSG
jgi:hypothetical protein